VAIWNLNVGVLRTNLCIFAEVKILFLKPEEEKDKTHFTDKEVRVKVFYILVCEKLRLSKVRFFHSKLISR